MDQYKGNLLILRQLVPSIIGRKKIDELIDVQIENNLDHIIQKNIEKHISQNRKVKILKIMRKQTIK